MKKIKTMEGDKVGFDGNFPVGDYLYRHYSMETTVRKGETDDEAWDRVETACWNRYAKQYPEWAEWFKNNQSQPIPEVPVTRRFEDNIIIIEPAKYETGSPNFQEPSTIEPEPQLPPLEDQIKSCTELKVLESYKFIVKGKPEQEVYNKKYKQLSK